MLSGTRKMGLPYIDLVVAIELFSQKQSPSSIFPNLGKQYKLNHSLVAQVLKKKKKDQND